MSRTKDTITHGGDPKPTAKKPSKRQEAQAANEEEEVVSGSPKRKYVRRSIHNYHLGEKDHKAITDLLAKFVPAYVIARKIGCDYHCLLRYIKAHPELEQCQKDADDNMVAIAKGKLMSKVIAGHAGSIMFLLERLDRAHFGRYQTIENIGELPQINIGTYKESDFVEPIDPSKVVEGGNAKEILAAAAVMARQRLDEQDAAEEAAAAERDLAASQEGKVDE